MFEPGEKFENYEIVRSLGRGGMGQVFLAVDINLERNVALKFLHLDMDESNHGVRARFGKEAKILASFDHPNIVRVYSIGEYQGCPYMVMEYVEGRTLLNLIKTESLDLNNKQILMRNILIGIYEAHKNGVLHRDIKPANIILCEKSGMPKVLDFGISKEIKEDSSVISNAEALMGTVSYMAPEQIQSGEVSPQSDIFSMGVLFFELFTGRNPFKTSNNVSTMYNICNKNPSLSADAAEDVPVGIRMIVDKMISKDVLDRYWSVEDILADLDNLDSLSLPNLHTLVSSEDDDEVLSRHQAMETLGDMGYSDGQVSSILDTAELGLENDVSGGAEFVGISAIGKAIDRYEENKPEKKGEAEDVFIPHSKGRLRWGRVGMAVLSVIFVGIYFFGSTLSPVFKPKVASLNQEVVKLEAEEKSLQKNRIYLVQVKNMDTGETEERYKERLMVVSRSGDFFFGKLINESTGKENQVQFVANPFLPPLRKVANVGEADIRNDIRRGDKILPITQGKKFFYYFDEHRDQKKVQYQVNCHAGEKTVYSMADQNFEALKINCLSRSKKGRIRTRIVYSSEHNLILQEERFFQRNGDRYKEIRELIKQ